jgi:predicted lipid-binding transport protein (Tim44 family)
VIEEAPAYQLPEGFDQIAFLANAKHYFTRLQKAWDAGDLEALREFTTPEMFASLQRDLQGRAEGVNHTDVVTLNAELLGVETDTNTYLCSVEFSGLIREQAEGPAEPFREVWNLSKPVNGPGGWVLAGIQQLV